MLVVGSFNVQNKFWLKRYNGKWSEQNGSLLLNHFLHKYHIDVLGTQEFVTWYLESVKKSLHDYKIVGDFRYFRPILKKYNETNSILSKRKILNTKTYHISKFPVFPPRIVTSATIETEDGPIYFLNTHLTLRNKKAQEKELAIIYQLIKESKYPTILTGDFNMTIHNDLMKDFIEKLKQIGMKRIPIYEKTYKAHQKENAIDHIFVSQAFEIIKYEVVKDEEFHDFSDHFPIVVFLKR